jgi:hypothetical protein
MRTKQRCPRAVTSDSQRTRELKGRPEGATYCGSESAWTLHGNGEDWRPRDGLPHRSSEVRARRHRARLASRQLREHPARGTGWTITTFAEALVSKARIWREQFARRLHRPRCHHRQESVATVRRAFVESRTGTLKLVAQHVSSSFAGSCWCACRRSHAPVRPT